MAGKDQVVTVSVYLITCDYAPLTLIMLISMKIMEQSVSDREVGRNYAQHGENLYKKYLGNQKLLNCLYAQ